MRMSKKVLATASLCSLVFRGTHIVLIFRTKLIYNSDRDSESQCKQTESSLRFPSLALLPCSFARYTLCSLSDGCFCCFFVHFQKLFQPLPVSKVCLECGLSAPLQQKDVMKFVLCTVRVCFLEYTVVNSGRL